MLNIKNINLNKTVSIIIKTFIILLILSNAFLAKAYGDWQLSYASIDAKIFMSKNLNQNIIDETGIISFEILVEYFKPVKKYYYSTVYKIKVNCFEKKTSFLEKIFYSDKLSNTNYKNKTQTKKMKLLDNKRKNFWYKFQDIVWWTLVSEDACEKVHNNSLSNPDVELYKIRLSKLANEFSNDDIRKIKNYFGDQLFKKILMIREKNWIAFKKRLIRDMNSNKF